MTPAALRAARERLGLSQRGLADALRMKGRFAEQTVGEWERGKREVPGPVQVAIEGMLREGLHQELRERLQSARVSSDSAERFTVEIDRDDWNTLLGFGLAQRPLPDREALRADVIRARDLVQVFDSGRVGDGAGWRLAWTYREWCETACPILKSLANAVRGQLD